MTIISKVIKLGPASLYKSLGHLGDRSPRPTIIFTNWRSLVYNYGPLSWFRTWRLKKPLILALSLVIGLSYASEDSSPVILVIGDSLSSAYGLDPQQGWVNLLAQRLSEQGIDHRVINASITGDTTRGGLARLPQAIQRHRPAFVIIELGGNDGLRGIHPHQMQSNLKQMITLSQQADAQVLLVGVRLPANYGKAFTQRFEAVYPTLAQETGVAMVPYILNNVVEQPELFQADGIHPTAEAQEIMLENIWIQLEPLLRAKKYANPS